MVKSLHRYWVARVYWREANGWLKRLLAVSGTEDTPIRARTMYVAGHITNYYDPDASSELGGGLPAPRHQTMSEAAKDPFAMQ